MAASFIGGENRRKTTDLPQVTDKHNVVLSTPRPTTIQSRRPPLTMLKLFILIQYSLVIVVQH